MRQHSTIGSGIALLIGLAMLSGPQASAQVTLTGAGATFPNPIYTKWFDAYNKKTGVQINYQSIGSGGGIRQFTEGTVDFGASDGPMNDEQIAGRGRQRSPRAHRARRRGADLQPPRRSATPSSSSTAPPSPDIFHGQDHQVERPRPLPGSTRASSCPTSDIIVVHRSDGSGTSYIFTDFLDKFSPRVADQGRLGHLGQLADRARAERETRA